MDPLLLYRFTAAVRDSLLADGRAGFSLARVKVPDACFDPVELAAWADASRAEAVPLRWEGAALPPLPVRAAEAHATDRRLVPAGASGSALVFGDAVVAVLSILDADGYASDVVLAGERREGALGGFMDAFSRFARERARSSKRIRVVGDDDIPRPDGVGWDDLLLPDGLKAEFRRQVDAFFAAASEYARLGVPHRRGLLLAGPPGNGKTTALRVVAALRPEPFVLFTVKPGSHDRDFDRAFDRAAFLAPSILCFEDLDSLFGDDAPLSHFLNRLDGLRPLDGVLVLATTNHPERLDPALTDRPSRFDRVFVFGPPGDGIRRDYLRASLGPAWDEALVAATDGFSMAQLKEIRVAACLDALAQGLAAPTPEGAFRAVDRLKGQKAVAISDWTESRAVTGFAEGRPPRPAASS